MDVPGHSCIRLVAFRKEIGMKDVGKKKRQTRIDCTRQQKRDEGSLSCNIATETALPHSP